MNRQDVADISKYNNFATHAGNAERAGNYDFARKMWDEASVLAAKHHWRSKVSWCEVRIAFCERQLKLGKGK